MRPRGPLTIRHVYWWSQDIATLRADTQRARRVLQRIRRRHPAGVQAEELAYRTARTHLVAAIKEAKSVTRRRLEEDLDDDVWGRAYRII